MAAVSNLYIDQGADFSTTISLTDSNGQILSLTGQITLTLADTVTAGIESGRYVYDVLITDSSGDKTRILEGQATVTPSVSR